MFSSTALASYYDNCQVEATVIQVKQLGVLNTEVSQAFIDNEETNTFTHIAQLQVTAILQHEGHSDCEHLKQEPQWIELRGKDREITTGMPLKLQYQFVSGRRGGGYGSNLEWSILKP